MGLAPNRVRGNNIGIVFEVLPHLFQYIKGSTRTGGKYDPATGSEACQFVGMIVC
jgi:hypothetical protein